MKPISDERTIGNVAVKIGVTVEPSSEFEQIAYALGFVRVTRCYECALCGTSMCPIKDGASYVAFCSYGERKDDGIQ